MNSKTLGKKYFNFGVADRKMFQLSTEQSFPQNENGSFYLFIIYFYCSFLRRNHATSKEWENGVFTLKTHQMFPFHTTMANLKNAATPAILDLCLGKPRSGKPYNYREHIVFKSKRSVPKSCFRSTRKRKANVFKKLRFRGGFVWTVGQTEEIQLRCQNSSAQCVRCLRRK